MLSWNPESGRKIFSFAWSAFYNATINHQYREASYKLPVVERKHPVTQTRAYQVAKQIKAFPFINEADLRQAISNSENYSMNPDDPGEFWFNRIIPGPLSEDQASIFRFFKEGMKAENINKISPELKNNARFLSKIWKLNPGIADHLNPDMVKNLLSEKENKRLYLLSLAEIKDSYHYGDYSIRLIEDKIVDVSVFAEGPEEACENINHFNYLYKYLDDELKNHPDVIKAVKKSLPDHEQGGRTTRLYGEAIIRESFYVRSLGLNDEIIRYLKMYFSLLKFFPDGIRADKKFILDMLKANPRMEEWGLRYIHHKALEDMEFVMNILRINQSFFEYMPEHIRSNPKIAENLLQDFPDGRFLYHISEPLKSNLTFWKHKDIAMIEKYAPTDIWPHFGIEKKNKFDYDESSEELPF